MFKKFKSVTLPVTEEQHRDLCQAIADLNPDIESKQKIAAALSMAISFLPKEQARVRLQLLSDTVRKACSTHLSKYMAEKIGHEASVDFLVEDAKLTGNQQSIDQLTQAAAGGSEYAQKALAELGHPYLTPPTLVPDAQTT